MKKNIHPKCNIIRFKCGCGIYFDLNLAMESKTFNIEVCNECHPFYTGQQKIIDVSGRVDNFYKKFGKLKQ